MTSTQALRLRVSDLTVGLAAWDAHVIEAIDLRLDAGKVLGLVGESGSGKSTLGLSLLGYARPGLRIVCGEVLVDGTAMLSLSGRELREALGAVVAYVPQDPGTALNPARRIGVQLREVMVMRGWSTSDVDTRLAELLDEVGLENVEHAIRSFPHQLSGGQQQRVALAMSFACRPALIVLDEPTTGLDVATQQRILDTVTHLCEAYRVAAVYISHDLAVVEKIADQVAVMYAGEIVEYGETSDVLRAPQHPYTRALLRAQPSPDGSHELVGIRGLPPKIQNRHVGCAFVSRCDEALDPCATERPPTVEGPGSGYHRCWLIDPLPPLEASFRRPEETAVESTAPAVMQVRDLSAAYGDKAVLHDLSFQVLEGQCVAIVGESGSGKSTLSRCLVGLHENWNGSVEFEGENLPHKIRRRSPQTLRHMQFIFQNPYASLNPRKSIASTLTQQIRHFDLCSPADAQAMLVEAMHNARLDESTLTRYPHQLSGGERQRVAIARALVADPSLLICDEVTSALDVSVQASLISLLTDLQRERSMSLLFVTHNLALVRTFSQHVVVMSDGRIVEQGATRDVFERPQHPYTQALLATSPGADGKRKEKP